MKTKGLTQHLAIDSTNRKIYGKNERRIKKYGTYSKRLV
ncbi:hypothetical protein BTN50_0110 [Candidatus Enterovibrio altilux]|uniref:Mobile element protein n=1 Tax=Candidatus Enterovibrio altilux TaxID=1927128 RepID=A0A291B6L6_9GAMM|nr:hypothetical protein BTN50_0110 [Candidatus Enterovibrio luxaltus]